MVDEKAEDRVGGGVTLIWKKRTRDLWIEIQGTLIAVIWGVTNLEKVRGSSDGSVRVYSEGEQMAILWDVVNIQEN